MEADDLTPYCVKVLDGINRQISHLPVTLDEEPNNLDNLLKVIRQVRKRFIISYVSFLQIYVHMPQILCTVVVKGVHAMATRHDN